jgi:hypothetical protein
MKFLSIEDPKGGRCESRTKEEFGDTRNLVVGILTFLVRHQIDVPSSPESPESLITLSSVGTARYAATGQYEIA